MGRLDGKVALITGAASGIGSATARVFSREGARIVGFDANGTGDEDWNAAVSASPESFLVAGDVRDEAGLFDLDDPLLHGHAVIGE